MSIVRTTLIGVAGVLAAGVLSASVNAGQAPDKSLDGVSSDPRNGGPYVMYKGTPYAHIMAPIAGSTGGAPSAK